MSQARRVFLLGPQRLEPILKETLRSAGVAGRLAVVTAGWEEREHEHQELAEHVGGDVVNLSVFERVEDVFRRDPELLAAMRNRHDRLRKVQELYRLRLSHALDAARALLARDEDPGLIDPEREDAFESARRLDEQHVRRVHEVNAEFEERWRPAEREHVVRHRREVRQLLRGAAALCVAGGHVAILLNRMRALDVIGAAGELPVFAWSAGAMVMAERIVLFHDNPPQGAGFAEVLEAGFGLCPGIVPLPHAGRRLRLEDAGRVQLLARRFPGSLCVALDPRSRVDWDGTRYELHPGTRRLEVDGAVREPEVAR